MAMQEHRLLIVEDESIVAMDIERRLIKLGYHIVGIAADGGTALDLIEEHLPDIILMDIHIKGARDGIEIAAQVHQDYHIPIIFLTAFSEDTTLNRASAVKPYGYLLKPFSERELHATIQVAIERFHHDTELRKSETHLRLALDSAQLGTWELGSPNLPIIFGYMPHGVLARIGSWHEFSESVIEADQIRVKRQVDLLYKKKDAAVEIEFQINNASMGHRWMVLYGKTYLDGNANKYRAVGVLQDVTDRRLMEDKLLQAAMVYECSADGIVILDSLKQVISANQAFYRITGFDESEVAARELSLLNQRRLGPELYHQIWQNLEDNGSWQGEVRGYCKDGEFIHAWMNIASVPDSINSTGQYVVILSDITAVHDAQEQLSHIAYYDTLTDLPNRNLFMDRLEHALAKCRRDQEELALLFIDLDHFKRVNDTLGHQVGDLLLRAAAQRLKTQLRETDTLCRVGGDEFVVIIESLHSSADVETLAKKLLLVLNKPLQLGAMDVNPTGSIGISCYPADTTDRDDLIKMADTAMYAAKTSGRNNYCFYRSEMTESTAHYLLRERELRAAISDNQFLLHYQPQVSASSGELVGLEALIRWQHPDRGLLAAGEIIPVAEGSFLIVEIGDWVVDAVCRQLRGWLDSGWQPPRVAINTSVRQLQSRDFLSKLMTSLNRYEISSQYLELEVTESCLQGDEMALSCLQELQTAGITVSIDDFGTGYSCMSSLKFLPIHKLKIDQSFVRAIPGDDDDCAIASAIVALGKQMHLTVIAEGIETQAQANFMREIGCDEFQGYYFGRPQLPDELHRLFGETSKLA